jgi:putative ATP-binding cassette transporter
MTQPQKFDRQFFRDFWRLLKPYWTSEEKWSAWGLLSLVIISTIIQVEANVGINKFFKEFFDAVQKFDIPVLIHESFHFIWLFAVAILAFGYGLYFGGLLTIRWRRWLTNYYLHHWLGEHNFYTMQVLHKNVDNPDQRISEDLDTFPATTLTIFAGLFQSLLTLVAFSYILWNLSGSIHIPLGKFGTLTVPGYMLIITLIYAILGTWLTILIGRNYLASIINNNILMPIFVSV